MFAQVMDEIGAKLRTIHGLNVKAWNAASVTPPAAVVALPKDWDYLLEYGPGSYVARTTIHIVVGKLDDRTSRDTVDRYMEFSGDYSVYQRVESGPNNTYTTCDTVTITAGSMLVYENAGVEYLNAAFDIEFARHGVS